MRKVFDIRQALAAAAMFAALPLMSKAADDEAPRELRPDAPYTAEKSDPVTHDVDLSIVVTPPYHCRVLKVWIPVPQSDQAQKISGGRFTTFPMRVEPQIDSEPVYGNRFAYFEFRDPQGAQIIRHRFKAKVWNQRWNFDSKSVASVTDWPRSFEPYLQPQSLADQQQFDNLLREIVPRRKGASIDMADIMHWIDGNLTYDHINASLKADANHAVAERRGHCSDYHGLCATMGRALGYPTRVTYGLSLFPRIHLRTARSRRFCRRAAGSASTSPKRRSWSSEFAATTS